MADVALFIDWENVYYTLRQHSEGALPSSLKVLQAILSKAAEFGSVRIKQAIFGQEVAAQDETLLMALEFTGIEPIAVAQRMSGRLLKGRADSVLIVRALRMLYKERPDLDTWFIVSGDRDLNALCKALKDEDKRVYLIAGDKALANELRESPYLRDDVFLLEEILPEIRLRPPEQRVVLPEEPRSRIALRSGRGRVLRRVADRPAPLPVIPMLPARAPTEDTEQRRLAVLLLDQVVATGDAGMSRDDFVSSVVPVSEREGRRVLEELIDAGISQGHLLSRTVGRARSKGKQQLALNFGSPLVAETVFQLVRLLRRVDSVLGKEQRRIPVVEAVLDPLSRADQPGVVQGRGQRRTLLETLFSIAEERGAVVTEQVGREGRQIAMCWLQPGHPLVEYSRRSGASVILLLHFAQVVADRPEERDWTNASLVPELLARAEGDDLDTIVKSLVDAGAVRIEERGTKRRVGYVLVRDHELVKRVIGESEAVPQTPTRAAAVEKLKRPTRRGSRGGRGRRRQPAAVAASDSPAAENPLQL
ncbi:MAG: hypothetical protein AUH85_12525 [Chloroflexi bacterium 13_1_40CM_4_68_4]|nr:MAG: hypothetical protein AUH85_12525 [Chloroflexi bacterium 13_1_40CM_4_68_4]